MKMHIIFHIAIQVWSQPTGVWCSSASACNGTGTCFVDTRSTTMLQARTIQKLVHGDDHRDEGLLAAAYQGFAGILKYRSMQALNAVHTATVGLRKSFIDIRLWQFIVISNSITIYAITVLILLLAIFIAVLAISSRLDPSYEYPSQDGRERAIELLSKLGTTESSTNLTVLTATCCLAIFSEGFYITQIYPYLSFMTVSLLGGTTSLGFYSGLLQSAPYFGMLVSSYGWGVLANSWGRRTCLLMSLFCNAAIAASLIRVHHYWLAVALRSFGGLTNCNYMMCYTMLKEGFHSHGADHRAAFVQTSSAFTLSTLIGPSMGGLLYNNGVSDTLTPWMWPMALSCALYVCAAFTCCMLANDEPPQWNHQDDQLPSNHSLLVWPFLCLMVMGGSISYVFIGWELGYPLLARVPRAFGGEAWDTKLIGLTFLLGSIALLCYSTFLYEPVLKKYSALTLWNGGFLLSSILLLIFPFILHATVFISCTDATSTESCRSASVTCINWFAHAVISVCVGGNFVTVQLILNEFVAGLPQSKQALPIAQSVLQIVNCVIRSVAPLVTGLFFTLSDSSEKTTHALPFTHLGIIAFVCCVGGAAAYERTADYVGVTLERARETTGQEFVNEPTRRSRESSEFSVNDLIAVARESTLEQQAPGHVPPLR